MSFMGDVVALDVRDDGVGFRVEETVSSGATGFGLNGMRQRVARVAGSAGDEIGARRGNGDLGASPGNRGGIVRYSQMTHDPS